MVGHKKFIAVEGPIGVGKTTLARRLADEFEGELLLEQVAGNPFLEQFYSSPRASALPTQLSFLMQRVGQLEALRQQRTQNGPMIADFLIDKDKLFAQNTLTADELDLYNEIHSRVVHEVPVPDLVIYLQAPVDVLLKRIAKRGRAFERPVSSTYLSQLSDAYTSFFHYYEDSPLLIVNATEIDIVSHDEDYLRLLEQIRVISSGKHFFNPLPFSSEPQSGEPQGPSQTALHNASELIGREDAL